jgi:two-component system chemotaxis sensor kinase CheA
MLPSLRKIGVKLAILAGAPLLGTLLLAAEIAREDRTRGESAAAIGSFEDLAELSARMNTTVNELERERAHAALALGLADDPEQQALAEQAKRALTEQEGKTDDALSAMAGFLAHRDLKRLPQALSNDLAQARAEIEQLGPTRQKIAHNDASIDFVLTYYASVCHELTDATAALSRLSDDGELLRALSSLVAAMRAKESESEQHALLAHVFAKQEFAPGLYRRLVNLVTEEQVYASSLKGFASRNQVLAYERTQTLPAATESDAMRAKALATVDDNFGIAAATWFDTEQQATNALEKFEAELAREARSVARRKVHATEVALRWNEALVLAVVLVSISLTLAVGRGISRSVLSLSKVTGRVQEKQDFSVRAEKTSSDELGALTDAFNAMLQGIQDRDSELSAHRQNLEKLVLERTAELSKRNQDLRFVLDTVEQGLVTIDKQGLMSSERSRAFDRFFGAPEPDVPFFNHIAASAPEIATRLELDWVQLTEGILPLEVTLEQAQDRIQLGSSHFAIHYNPLLSGEEVTGALLTISDVTRDVQAREAEAIQSEQLKTFTRLMKDKPGFVEFFNEAEGLLRRIQGDEFASESERLRAIHTLKGNAALFDVTSVASAAHRLEDALLEGTPFGSLDARAKLIAAWEAFSERIVPLLGERSDRIEVKKEELDELLALARSSEWGARTERLLLSLCDTPILRRFERLSQQLRALAARLGKAPLQIEFAGGEIRLPDQRFAAFWSALVHVVRNVADHGLESEAERAAAGKPDRNRVLLSACLQGNEIVLEIADDGRGVDWQAVAVRARALGLPGNTQGELAEALFASALSTAEGVTNTSGRGVGMSAVRQACRDLGGDCRIESEPRRGTKLTCRLPLAEAPAESRSPAVSVRRDVETTKAARTADGL